MTEGSSSERYTSIHADATVTIRQRPALLVMAVTVEAEGPTLALALEQLDRRCDATSKWLQRLDATSIEFSEPTFTAQETADPMSMAGRMAARALQQQIPGHEKQEERGKKVFSRVTGVWSIEDKSAHEVLIFLDHLQFEAGDLAGDDEGDESDGWESMAEQMQEFVAGLATGGNDEGSPTFLFISRLDEERYKQALAEALAATRDQGEMLAAAAGRQLGTLNTLNGSIQDMDVRNHNKIMERQRCASLLAGTSYDLRRNEMVSDDPQPAEFVVQVIATYSIT